MQGAGSVFIGMVCSVALGLPRGQNDLPGFHLGKIRQNSTCFYNAAGRYMNADSQHGIVVNNCPAVDNAAGARLHTCPHIGLRQYHAARCQHSAGAYRGCPADKYRRCIAERCQLLQQLCPQYVVADGGKGGAVSSDRRRAGPAEGLRQIHWPVSAGGGADRGQAAVRTAGGGAGAALASGERTRDLKAAEAALSIYYTARELGRPSAAVTKTEEEAI